MSGASQGYAKASQTTRQQDNKTTRQRVEASQGYAKATPDKGHETND
ncbi:MAG: hypothetical protein IKY22_10410 [Bacteroidales bacterium]|nr:hypothetical protein [Bacteroidales bacterium]